MADYSDSKPNERSSFPLDAVDGQGISRLEPIINPEKLKRMYLLGIPLVSSTINPFTKKADVMTNDDINEHILNAIGNLESDLGVDVVPVQRIERHPFDRALIAQFGHFKLNHAPILSVEELSISSGQSNAPIYTLPNDWIDTSYFNTGLVYLTPLLPASTVSLGGTIVNTNGGAAFLQFILNQMWCPTLWLIRYTSGFKNGNVPRVINELIGCYAAMDILSMLATTNRANTASLGLDGMSQSVSSPGVDVYKSRIEFLAEKKKGLMGKIKKLYQRKFVMTNI